MGQIKIIFSQQTEKTPKFNKGDLVKPSKEFQYNNIVIWDEKK